MHKFMSLLVAGLLCAVFSTGLTCTIYGASGNEVAGGGTLIGKNGDGIPHEIRVELKTGGKYQYYGVLGDVGDNFLTFAGVNEKGLAVVNAAASCIPKDVLYTIPNKVPLATLLKNCATVSEALSMKSAYVGPVYVLISDGKEVALVEVGENGKTHMERSTNGVFTHTNSYHSPEFQYLNMKSKEDLKSSTTRQARIDELMQNADKPMTMDTFIDFSEDRHDGPNNSIWRDGSTERSVQTLSTFIVDTQPDGNFTVRVKYRPLPEDKGNETLIIKTKAELFPHNLCQGVCCACYRRK